MRGGSSIVLTARGGAACLNLEREEVHSQCDDVAPRKTATGADRLRPAPVLLSCTIPLDAASP